MRRVLGNKSQGNSHARSDTEKRLGRNRNPYYGNVGDAIAGQKHGAKAYGRFLSEQGATRRGGRYDRLPSGSGQLLGG